ncbi:MAG: inorganic diphosphatase [Acidobacteriota bacterium]|nr:inorganic diphosphatase [Acidobacteriota bacterium]
MSNLLACAHRWDPEKLECKAIIETPKGQRNKFNYEPEYRTFGLGGPLPEGLAFPFDFGFIPSTGRRVLRALQQNQREGI